MNTTEIFLVAMLIIFTVPFLIWRLTNSDYYAPLVVVQIITGILLGPGILGSVYPDYYKFVFNPAVVQSLNGIAWWAVMLFVMLAGIELDLKEAWKSRRETGITASLALGMPLIFGAVAALWLSFHDGWIGKHAETWQFTLGVGMACAVTALPILVLLMEKMGIMREPLGQRILRYASLDDIAIWGVLALILMDWSRMGKMAGFVLAFVIASRIFRNLMQRLQERDRWYVSLIWLAACGLGADWAGLHFLVGAFLAGVAMDAHWFDEKKLDYMRQIVLLAVMPVFFLSTGLRTDWGVGGASVFLAATLLLVASVTGKLVGVHIAGKLLGWKPGEASIIGWLLQTKALIMIIFANILLDKNVITNETFTALLLAAIASTMLTVPVTYPKLRRARSALSGQTEPAVPVAQPAAITQHNPGGKKMADKIAVIGTGLSGLATVKELVEAGLDVTCFEKSHGIGGVFSGGEASKCYDSVVLTTSNYFTAFSDFMPYGEPLKFWTGSEYLAYLHRYANHFKLFDHIKFGHAATSLKKLESGKWELEVTNDSGQTQTEVFDRVAICSGQFQMPNIPQLPGIETFPGPTLHSSSYKNTNDVQEFRGKRVLCFGSGESAANVINEIAEIAGSAVLSLRRRHVHSLRFPAMGKFPIDVAQTRYWHSLPAAIKTNLLRQLWKQMLRSTSDKAIRLFALNNLSASDEPGSVVTKTELIFQAQARHGLRIDVGGVQEIKGKTVIFKSGQQEEFDAIAYCTGFKFSVPFLEARYQPGNIRNCYLNMFHADLRDSLAFIGFARPQQGGIPLIAELQARYFALLCTGQRELPANLQALAERDAARWRNEFYATPHVSGLVNGLRYNENLAALIGCRPPVPNPVFSPARFLKYWFHHIWPNQYRIVGPGARAEARENWLKSPSIMTTGKQVRAVLRMATCCTGSLFMKADANLKKWRPVFEQKFAMKRTSPE